MGIKKVDLDKRLIVYFCPECEERFGLDVECVLDLNEEYSHGKYRRVFEFLDTHEDCCVAPSKWMKPVIKKEECSQSHAEKMIQEAIAIFDAKVVSTTLDMEQRW